MGSIKLDFDVGAPIERVWDLGLQAARIPEWQFDVVAVKGIDGPISRQGTKYVLVYQKAGRLLESPVEVSCFEPVARTVETTGRTPLGGYFASRTVMSAIAENRTHIDWAMEYRLPGWFVGVVMDKLLFQTAFRKTVRRYNANFQILAEREFTVDRL